MLSLLRRPWFSWISIATLALGIAACTIVFTLVQSVLLKPLPYREPAQIVTVLHPGDRPVSPADFSDWRRSAVSFESLEAASVWEATISGDDAAAERITGLQMTPGMFRLLGAGAALGETFTSGVTGREKVVVLSDALWRRRFNADPGIVGRKIRLSQESYIVSGVMPPTFQFPPFWATSAEMWVPLDLTSAPQNRDARMLRVFGKLAPSASLPQAQSEMKTIAARLASEFPDSNAGLTVSVDRLTEKASGTARRPVLLLFGAVGMLMLIAGTNVAGLTLARAVARRKEIGVRVALGASAMRVARQLLGESLTLGFAGAAVGISLALFALRFVSKGLSHAGADLARLGSLEIDSMTLLFTAALAILTSVFFGFAPAVQAGRSDVVSNLRDTARGSSEGTSGVRLRSGLVIVEVALCMVLLAGAGVMIRSYLQLRAIDPGFNSNNLLTMSVSVAGRSDYVGERRDAFYALILDSLRQLPGVTSGAMVNHLPVGGDTWGTRVAAEGAPLPAPGQEVGAVFRVAGSGYLRTMQIALERGREFTDSDRSDSPRVAIINQKLARKLWPSDNDVLGQRLTLDDPRKGHAEWLSVVGVTRNVRQNEFTSDPEPELYLPYLQAVSARNSSGPASASMTFVIRTSTNPAALAASVRSAVAGIDKEVSVARIRSVDRILDEIFWQSRITMAVTAVFAIIALVLACVGIYSVMAFVVRSRFREIGIRMALGADRAKVLGLFVRHGAALIAAGMLIGLPTAAVLARGIASVIYGVSPWDPVVFLVAPILLITTGLCAVIVPALRGASSAPLDSLREN